MKRTPMRWPMNSATSPRVSASNEFGLRSRSLTKFAMLILLRDFYRVSNEHDIATFIGRVHCTVGKKDVT